MIKKFSLVFVVFLFIGFTSCNNGTQKKDSIKPLRIAISKMHGKHTYSKWLHNQDSTLILINMYPLGIDSALKTAANVDGILITGGEDVFPGYYGRAADTINCGTINRYRDSLEMALINYAVKNNIPLIGVCRGEQIINVTLGGSLIVDIPTEVGTKVKHSSKDWKLQWHEVDVVPNTLMAELTRVKKGKVSSSHHQCIDKTGKGLKISAYAPDSVPEAIEWNSPKGRGFLMATQWHPEHMDYNNPLSYGMAKEFLKNAYNYREKRISDNRKKIER